MSLLEGLISATKPLLGATVTAGTLMIWPDKNGPEHSDSQLNLKLKLTSGENISITFRTDPDGQTPLLEKEDVEPNYHFSQLSERIENWTKQDYWDRKGSYRYETFNIAGSVEFRGVVGSEIIEIGLIYFDDEEKLPTGLKITFSSDKEIWSVPGTYGNVIMTELPADWFEEPVKMLIVGM